MSTNKTAVSSGELMIGNYIYDDFNEIHRVEYIKSERFNEWNGADPSLVVFSKINPEDKGMYSCDAVSGIPLTPEILEKCGFDKSVSNDDEEREIYSIQVANNTSLYFDRHKDWMRDDLEVDWYLSHEWNNNHLKNNFLGSPKHLHQLQNLYHALTGSHLKVDEI